MELCQFSVKVEFIQRTVFHQVTLPYGTDFADCFPNSHSQLPGQSTLLSYTGVLSLRLTCIYKWPCNIFVVHELRLSPLMKVVEMLLLSWLKNNRWGFPGGTVVENLPANAGDTGSSPGLGGSHMPWSNWAREPQLLSLSVWSLCSATREAAIVRGPRTAMKSGPHLPQLEKALTQKWRPNTAINK